MAVLSAYYAALCDHSAAFAPGERATLPIMSASVQQASKALNIWTEFFQPFQH